MVAGLTEEEKAEGTRAKDALEEEAGGMEDGEDGDYKGKSQFFTHLKKSEVSAYMALFESLLMGS
jgi:hypothetical protein